MNKLFAVLTVLVVSSCTDVRTPMQMCTETCSNAYSGWDHDVTKFNQCMSTCKLTADCGIDAGTR